MKRILISTCAIFAASLASRAQTTSNEFDVAHSERELSAVTKLAAGYGISLRCDFRINDDVAGKYLDDAFGGRKFSAVEVAKIADILIGIIAFQNALPGTLTKRECAQLKRGYGATGDTIPGLAK